MSADLAPTTPTKSHRPSWVLALALLVVAAVAFAAGYALRGSQGATPMSNSAQLASVRSGCDGWAAASKSSSKTWCSGMAGWMNDQMGSEAMGPGMMGAGMWGGPDQLRKACRQWAKDNPGQTGNSPASTCDDMVTWMNGHASGGWQRWPMHDH